MERSGRQAMDRVARRGARAGALALAVAACVAAAAPAGAATMGHPPGPGVPAPVPADPPVPHPVDPAPHPADPPAPHPDAPHPADPPAPHPADPPAPHPDAPHPGGPPVTRPGATPPAPLAAPQPDDATRPVARRPAAGGPGAASGASLAIRRLTVTARVSLEPARPAALTVSFVPRAGSLVAQVRVIARRGTGRRILVTRFVRVRSGRQATVRLRLGEMRPGVYAVSVRAGAARTTLGPAIVAKLRID